MNLLLFIIVVLLLIIILYLILINKKTNLNFLKKIEYNVERMSDFSDNINLSKYNIDFELNKIEKVINSYNDASLSENNRIIINDLRNKIDIIKKELDNPYAISELKKEIGNKILELEKTDKVSYNNKDNIEKIDKNLIKTQDKLRNEYLKNKNSKITTDKDDYFKLCNNNNKCIYMNVNNEGEYTIKSDTINFKNNNDKVIAKIDNNNIFLGGDNFENSGLYINDGKTHINKLTTNEFLLKDKNNMKMVDIGSYVEWLDNNKDFREYIDDVNYTNNVERIKEIDLLKNELKNINDNNKNLDKKIDKTVDNINEVKKNYNIIRNVDEKISNKYEIIKKELDEQLKRGMLTNNHMSKYKDSIDIELVKLYDNLNKLDKKTQKMEEIGKVRMELYERNKIEQEEMLLEQKKLWEQKIEEERKRREDKENIEKRIEEAELEAERKRLDEYIANIDE
jgi:hypothetical protein